MAYNDLVSIIMPAYNAEKYIAESIESVINQSYPNWELLIIDDGSTDRTKDLVEQFLLIDTRIFYYYQSNAKQGKARNLGIEKSKGELLAFIDSDDLWLENKLEIQVKEIDEKKVDLVFCDSFIFNDDDSQNCQKKVDVETRYYAGEDAIQLFIECNRIPILTVVAKKSVIVATGGFIEDNIVQYGEDYHLWLKLLLTGSVFYSTDLVLAKYRVHSESVTMQDKYQFWKILELFYNLKKWHPEFKVKLEKKIKDLFIKFYMENRLSKKELNFFIKKNTTFLAKKKQKILYQIVNNICPTKLTRRMLIHLLNG
jgi:teichuronic acid biosynthesis glycosyltransferase TuaG